jgi:alpha-N-acetylglucosaminidase
MRAVGDRRPLLTTWSEPQCYPDYANRQWNGLLSGFYLHRWQMWLAALNQSLAQGQPIDENKERNDIRDWEYTWVNGHESYPTAPIGNTVDVSRRLFASWSALASQEDPVVAKATLRDGAWDSTVTSTSREAWLWDITKSVPAPGVYNVTFKYTKGQSALEIHSVSVQQGKKVIASDVHEGWTGNDTRENVYTLDLQKMVPGTPLTLLATVECASSTDSAGTISILPKSATGQ